MQLFARPVPVGGVENFNEEVRPFQEKIKAIFGNAIPITKKKKPKDNKTTGKKMKEPDPFIPKWTDYKTIFAEAQNGKCGYCEMMVIGGQPGDVEHYYPKGEVWHLKDDPTTWGRERRWASTIQGRERDIVSERGYWWLAYDWANYLLACTACNQYWKLSYFPVENLPRQLPPRAEVAEVPLLLNPFDHNRQPAQHLRFNDLGDIEAKDGSSCGRETILTCGLDRESLRRSRLEKARRAYRLAQELAAAKDDATAKMVLTDFYELGREEYVHSGMVRAILEDLCGLTWAQLQQQLQL